MTDIIPRSFDGQPLGDTLSGDLGEGSTAHAWPFHGRLDTITGTLLSGWVLSTASPRTPVALRVAAGRAEATILPDREAPALSRLLGQPVRCRFAVDLAALFPGVDLTGLPVSVRVAESGQLLENAPQTVAGPRAVVAHVDRMEGQRILGWAVNTQDEGEVVEVEVLVDGHPIARIVANQQRRDLLARFTTCDHGFESAVPGLSGTELSLRDRRSGAVVFGPIPIVLDEVRASRSGTLADRLDGLAALLEEIRTDLPRQRRLAAYPIADYAAYHREHGAETAGRRARLAPRAAALGQDGPLFSVVMPVCDPPLWMLAEAIESVRRQIYGRWELCIADDASRSDAVRALLRDESTRDPRIRVSFAATRQGVCAATNRAIGLAGGDYVAFLDHDDRLSFDALLRMAEAIGESRAPVLYSDEDRIAPDGRHVDPALKPDLDPELLQSVNHVCHLLVVKRALLGELGGLRPGFEGVQDHDLVLRLLERVGAAGIRHVPRVLYHWRINPSSLSGQGGNDAAILDGIGRCVREHLARLGRRGTVTADLETFRASGGLFHARVRPALPTPAPMVSIIVPTKDAVDLVRDCVGSLLSRTVYPNFEVVLVDHDSAEPQSRPFFNTLARDPRVRVADFHGPFNWAAINNAAAAGCRGDVLCFLNNDIVVTEPDWLSEMVARLAQPGVGAVGAKLLYPNGTVQHAGVVLGAGGTADHAFAGLPGDAPGHLGQAILPRTVSAVTGACLVTSRTAFHAVGGFDMVHLPVAYADVDYCLKIQQAGLRVLWTPYARLLHLETQTRGADDTAEKAARLAVEAGRLRARWGGLSADPFYNPHFEPLGPTYGLLRPQAD
ncbi:glycosyltransferase [Azospirillum brasilense]|nr:glycosyltransferase [Azospirillum brasilense]